MAVAINVASPSCRARTGARRRTRRAGGARFAYVARAWPKMRGQALPQDPAARHQPRSAFISFQVRFSSQMSPTVGDGLLVEPTIMIEPPLGLEPVHS